VGEAFARLDLLAMGPVGFEGPDMDRFPCLELAYDVARKGGTAGAVLSAADEIAVQAFLDGRIAFGDIHTVLRRVEAAHEPGPGDTIEGILGADTWGREEARSIINRISGGE
jgi:1-deoxy-D-xylulose-5-phosphate reductoisomerase